MKISQVISNMVLSGMKYPRRVVLAIQSQSSSGYHCTVTAHLH